MRAGIRSFDSPPETIPQIWEALGDCAFLESVTFYATTTLIRDNNIYVNYPSLLVLNLDQRMWPNLFTFMNEHPDFIFQFFWKYHPQIFDGPGCDSGDHEDDGVFDILSIVNEDDSNCVENLPTTNIQHSTNSCFCPFTR